MGEMPGHRVTRNGGVSRRWGDPFRRLVEKAPDITMILNPDYSVRYVSPAVEALLGLRPSDIVGGAVQPYVHPEDRKWMQGKNGGARAVGVSRPLELRIRYVDGTWRLFEAEVTDLLEDPSVEGIAVYLHDVTGERALRAELYHRSFHDSLTGLPNRALFMDRVQHSLARAARYRGPITILFVDIDEFKAVNDRFGHEAGDALLVAVGRRLQSCVRPGDTVARFGGDEFSILLEDTNDQTDVIRVVRRVTRSIRKPVTVQGYRLLVTASIGASGAQPGCDTPEDLLHKADTAMYRAKRGGKNRFELFEKDASNSARQSLGLEHDLKGALARRELRMNYQPGVSLQSGKIVGMEALLRWDYPRCGPMPAAEIVALAETSGLIAPVGRWVLEEACRQALVWQERYPDDPPLMSVNLSARQLRQPALADEVAAAVRKTGLDPCNLALETQGGFSADDTPHVAVTVERLKAMGVRLTIDDFGKGNSSLSHLGRLPVDMLKIDRQFINELGENGKGTARLVSAMIGFARAMGIQAVAEGVETAEQRTRLHAMGCELAQGFYFWKPLPGDEATELLDRDRGL